MAEQTYAERRDAAYEATLTAIDDAVERRCSSCHVPLPGGSHSEWWCSEGCQILWQGRQVDAPDGLGTVCIEWEASDPYPRGGTWVPQDTACAWLRANGVDPDFVPLGSTIRVGDGGITVDVYRRNTDGLIVLNDDMNAPAIDEQTVPIAVALDAVDWLAEYPQRWMAGIEFEVTDDLAPYVRAVEAVQGRRGFGGGHVVMDETMEAS